MNPNKLFLNSSLFKSSGIPPSLRYGATLPALRTRRSSKSEGGFRRQPENSAAIACIQHKSL